MGSLKLRRAIRGFTLVEVLVVVVVIAIASGVVIANLGGDDRWIALDDDAVLAPRVLPADFTITAASYAGAPVAEDAVLPFRPSGRNEPYALLLANSAWSVLVAGDPLNRVQFAAQAVSP